MVHRGPYSYRQRVRVITLLPNIVFVLFLYVERFWKSYWMESLTRTSSSFAWCSACTFKSESVFSVVNKSWQRFPSLSLICDKKQMECGLAWYWWNSTDLGLVDMFLINVNTEIIACILSFRESRHKPNLENTIGQFITWRGNSALNCTRKPISVFKCNLTWNSRVR